MGIRHLATMLPIVAPLAHSRGHPALGRTRGLRNLQAEPGEVHRQRQRQPRPDATADFTADATADAVEPETTISAPGNEPDKCDIWIEKLIASDENDSGGLSGSEYYDFLSGIEDPPYIAEYFKAYEGFEELPWVFRVVKKSLACHCQKLGFGGECCVGSNAEIRLEGLEDDGEGGTVSNGAAAAYRDMICQQISFVLAHSIPSPAPTDAPFINPTKSPSPGPTASPSTAAPVPAVTGSPTRAPSEAPAAGPTSRPKRAPSAGPSGAPVTPEPTGMVVAVVEPVRTFDVDGGNSGNNRGLVAVGIIAACLLALVAAVVFVAHRRRENEQEDLQKFAGEQATEADLGATPRAPPPATEDLERKPHEDKESSAPEAIADNPPVQEPDEDDESSAPSVHSDSLGEDTKDKLHEDTEDPSHTTGSALAAMGAASTVAARIGANGNSC